VQCWCSSLRAEGFFCSLDVLYGGLGIDKLQFLFLSAVIFFSFWLSKPLIRIDVDPQMLDPDQNQINSDPKHWHLAWTGFSLPAAEQ
jgi:hypothetical protein